MKYHLLVKINGGSRGFSLDECNESTAGKSMSDIVEFIIESSEKNQATPTEEVVHGYVLEIKENEILVAQNLTSFYFQLIKDTSINDLIEGYNIRLIYLRGLSSGDYKKGDQITAIIDGEVNEELKPNSAMIKEVIK
jgi:hypothetical protein